MDLNVMRKFVGRVDICVRDTPNRRGEVPSPVQAQIGKSKLDEVNRL